MLTIGWSALMFLCAVGPLIIFHELGHYWAGRLCGVRAEAFSIGFGQAIAGWTDKRGTHWRIGWLPMGGYVKFAGEYELDGSPSPRQPFDGFETAKLWERAVIIAAGPAANFVTAFLIYCALIAAYGEPHFGTTVRVIVPNSAAQVAGFQPGDRIVSINNQPAVDFAAIKAQVASHANESMQFKVARGNALINLTARPKLAATIDSVGSKVNAGYLGLGPQVEIGHPAWYAVPYRALVHVGNMVGMIGTVLGKILTGQLSASLLGGPLQSAKVAAEAASYGSTSFLEFIAFISINLGFMNLLPVPVLDGGHLALYGIEAVRRRPLTPHVRETVFRTGLFALLALFAFVTINDLAAFGVWKQLVGLIG